MAEGGTAHALSMVVIRFFDDQRTRAYGSQRCAAADEKDMTDSTEAPSQALDVMLPVSEIGGDRGSSVSQLTAGAAQIALAKDIRHPLKRHQSRDGGFAGNRKLVTSLR